MPAWWSPPSSSDDQPDGPDLLADIRLFERGTSSFSPDTVELLLKYQSGIGTWMDLFDHRRSYREAILNLVTACPCVMHSICALTARQLALISDAQKWSPVAEAHYCEALSILTRVLDNPFLHPDSAMVGTMLLSSYELLAFPGADYKRHFQGAKGVIETLQAYRSSSQLIDASFWIFARHDIACGMSNECEPMLNPDLWPQLDFSVDNRDGCEDLLSNEMLRLAALVLRLVFGSSSSRMRAKWEKEWTSLQHQLNQWYEARSEHFKGIAYGSTDNQGTTRYMFPVPCTACAMQIYHVSKLFLALHMPGRWRDAQGARDVVATKIEHHTDEIINIGLSNLSDSVLVQAVCPLYHAAKHTRKPRRRDEVIQLLDKIQVTTGFHTNLMVDRLRQPSTQISSV